MSYDIDREKGMNHCFCVVLLTYLRCHDVGCIILLTVTVTADATSVGKKLSQFCFPKN
jgi:hypothetical protein